MVTMATEDMSITDIIQIIVGLCHKELLFAISKWNHYRFWIYLIHNVHGYADILTEGCTDTSHCDVPDLQPCKRMRDTI